MKDIKGNIITVGNTVRVVGNNFPNVTGIVTNVEEDRVDLTFKLFIQEQEIWEQVSLKGTDLVKIDNSKDYVFYNNEAIEYDEDIQE